MTSNIKELVTNSLNELNLSEKQKSVLHACLILFSEKGFENTSTSDIAKLANVAEGTVYQQFKTKSQLLEAIINPAIEKVIPVLSTDFFDSITKDQLPEFKVFLINIIENRLNFILDNVLQLRIIVREILTNKKIRQKIVDIFLKNSVNKFDEIFEYYQRKKELINWSTERIFRYIFSILGGYAWEIIFFNKTNINIEEVSLEASEFLFKGLSPN